MSSATKYYVLIGSILVLSINTLAQGVAAKSQTDDPRTKAAFEATVRAYVSQRREIESRMPSISSEASPEAIAAHKANLVKNIKAARTNAKQGEILTPAAAEMIARIIRSSYSDAELAALKTENSEADTKGVQLRVNAVYPEGREKIEMPPRLLLALPQLPDEVNYHFVGNSLMLLDKESGLILDFMTDALP